MVGEFVAADAGLGFLLTFARANYDAALLYAALLTLVALAVSATPRQRAGSGAD